MKISRTTVFEIANNTYRLEMLGRVNCYLLMGTERGLLIDCGFGLEPLKPLIDELCPLPYDVCITHADGDHMGACYEWDKVWLHPADNALAHDLEHVNFQRFTGMHTNLNPMLKRDADDLSNEVFYAMDELKPITLTPNDLPEFLPLKDGQIFDLGDRKVTVLLVPGHTMGSTVYLDDNTRILFSGDAISAASDIKLITATAGYHNMERLLTYADRFDRIYPAHTGLGPGAAGMNYSLPKSIIEDYMYICKHIVLGDLPIKERGKGPNPDFPQDKAKAMFGGPGGPHGKPGLNPDEKQAQGVVETDRPYGHMLHFNFRKENIIAPGEEPIV